MVLIQTLDAGLGRDEVVSAPNFATSTAWDHIDDVISIATATHRTFWAAFVFTEALGADEAGRLLGPPMVARPRDLS